MNKLLVANQELAITDALNILDLKGDSLHLICNGKCVIIIPNKETLNLDITLNDNSSLDLYIYSKYKNKDNKVTINQSNNTTLNYYEAFTTKDATTIEFKNIITGNNNTSNIKLRCIADLKNVTINVLAIASKDTQNNNVVEDIKGINNGGKITIMPDMEINTHDIVANHFVTIGNISKQDLFYLESRGISEEKSREIILKGFIESIFQEYKTIFFGGGRDE